MKKKGSGIYVSISDKIARIYIMDLWLEECVGLKIYIQQNVLRLDKTCDIIRFSFYPPPPLPPPSKKCCHG